MSLKTFVLALAFGTQALIAAAQFGNKYEFNTVNGQPLHIQYDKAEGPLYLIQRSQADLYLKLYPADQTTFSNALRSIGVYDPTTKKMLHTYTLKQEEKNLYLSMNLFTDLAAAYRNMPLQLVEIYGKGDSAKQHNLFRIQVSE